MVSLLPSLREAAKEAVFEGLAWIWMPRGEGERARAIVDSAAAYALETSNKRIMADVEAHRACLAQSTGAAA